MMIDDKAIDALFGPTFGAMAKRWRGKKEKDSGQLINNEEEGNGILAPINPYIQDIVGPAIEEGKAQ
jgi:hypothetical protein